ncbi:MAG: hypothetical protein VB091_06150 [Christensenella sp.]|nr:hypothetical protein [Christensenella sp.]
MKNKRIVASLSRIRVPDDRREAMLNNILAQAGVDSARCEPKRREPALSKRRKALLIAMAAVLLLLSACAAYAVYWSSTQRAKDYSQSEQATDDRRAQAERAADAILAGTTFYSTIDQTAEVDGISFSWKGANYWANDDPPELHLVFDAKDTKTNNDSRLYDVDYTLTVNGQTFSAYTKAEGTRRTLPAIARADAMDVQYEIWFRMDGSPVSDGTTMTLAGELYQYDANGQRTEHLGGFSIDFIYSIPQDQIDAERERLIAQELARLDAEAQIKQEALSGMPDETTPLNITQDEYTFVDAQTTKEGFLLGQSVVTRGAETPVFYMDGYRWGGETINRIFTPDLTRPRLDIAWEVEYYGTSETLTRYPWYAPVDELPETVLIAVVRDAGSEQRRKGGIEEELLSYEWQAVELLLRVNPRTGEITLPKDDAERKVWRAESDRLAADGRNDELLISLSGEQTINGVTVRLKQLHVQTERQLMFLTCEVDGMYIPMQRRHSPITLYLNGVSLGTRCDESEFLTEPAQVWVDSYGGWKKHNGFPGGGEFTFSQHPSRWPDTFSLRVVWELSDRDEQWNAVPIGTFDISTTVTQKDIVRGPLSEIYDLLR